MRTVPTHKLTELESRLRALQGPPAVSKQAAISALAEVIEDAKQRGCTLESICAALGQDQGLVVSVATLKGCLNRAKKRPAARGLPAQQEQRDQAPLCTTPTHTNPERARARAPIDARPKAAAEEVLRPGAFAPREDREDI